MTRFLFIFAYQLTILARTFIPTLNNKNSKILIINKNNFYLCRLSGYAIRYCICLYIQVYVNKT